MADNGSQQARTWANPWVRVRRVSIAFGVGSLGLFVTWLVLPWFAEDPWPAIAIVSSFALAAAWLSGLLVSGRPESPTFRALATRFGLITVAIPAPAALAVLMRLSRPTCTVMNWLGLPWTDEAKTVGVVLCLALLAAALAGTVAGALVRSHRSLAVGLLIYGVCAFLFAVFALYFGDPSPDCIPY